MATNTSVRYLLVPRRRSAEAARRGEVRRYRLARLAAAPPPRARPAPGLALRRGL